MIPVLWVAQVYPRFAGDLFGSFLHRLARELPARGYRPIVVAPGTDETPDHETVDGVEVVRFRSSGAESAGLVYSGEMHRAARKSPWAFLRFLREFRAAAARVAARENPALVHAHWWFPGGWAAAPLARPDRPLVVSLHGTDVRLLGKVPWARWFARSVLGKASCVLPVSEALRRDTERWLGGPFPGDVLPMPADGEIFRPSSGDPATPGAVRFVVAARLTEQKRVADAIEAFQMVSNAHPEAQLEIVGDGPEWTALTRRVAQLDLRNRVTFHGTLTAAELARRFQGARAAILCSEQEGYGLTLVEAALCGVPGVGVRSGALPELIADGETGLLVPPRDVTALAGALRKLAASPAEAARMGRAAAESATHRTAAPLADRLGRVYGDLAPATPRP